MELRKRRLRQRRLHHPFGEHSSPFSRLPDAVYLGRQRSEQLDAWVEHARELIETTTAAGRRGARIQGHHFGGYGKLFRERK